VEISVDRIDYDLPGAHRTVAGSFGDPLSADAETFRTRPLYRWFFVRTVRSRL
jgi:hypothetical protein